MLENILTFMTENKEIIIGAAVVVSELVVIIVNTRRRLKKKSVKLMGDKSSTMGELLWVANPINLFRRP